MSQDITAPIFDDSPCFGTKELCLSKEDSEKLFAIPISREDNNLELQLDDFRKNSNEISEFLGMNEPSTTSSAKFQKPKELDLEDFKEPDILNLVDMNDGIKSLRGCLSSKMSQRKMFFKDDEDTKQDETNKSIEEDFPVEKPEEEENQIKQAIDEEEQIQNQKTLHVFQNSYFFEDTVQLESQPNGEGPIVSKVDSIFQDSSEEKEADQGSVEEKEEDMNGNLPAVLPFDRNYLVDENIDHKIPIPQISVRVRPFVPEMNDEEKLISITSVPTCKGHLKKKALVGWDVICISLNFFRNNSRVIRRNGRKCRKENCCIILQRHRKSFKDALISGWYQQVYRYDSLISMKGY